MPAPNVEFYLSDDTATFSTLGYSNMNAGSNDNEPTTATHFPLHAWNDKGGALGSSDMTGVTVTTLRRLIELEALGTSDGTQDQSFTLANIPNYADSQTIYASGVGWGEVPSLSGVGLGNYYQINDTTGVVLFGDGTDGNIPPSGYPITGTYQPNTNLCGKEWVDDKWMKVRSIGIAGSGIVDDNESVYTPIGGSTVHSIGDIPSNCSRYLYLRVDVPSGATPTGMNINLRFRVSYSYI